MSNVSPKPMELDRNGIQRLSLVYTQGHLAHEFGISVPTYRAYVRGREPRTAITLFINQKITNMLNSKADPIGALEFFCRESWSHCQYLPKTNTLFIAKKAFDKQMKKLYPRENVADMLIEQDLITGTNRIDFPEGKVCEAYILDMCEIRLEPLKQYLLP